MRANRKFRIFAAWAVAAFILAGGAAGVMQAFAAGTPPELKPFFKADYPAEDSVSRGLTPNVLFFLESSTAMMFAPWGIVPTVSGTYGKTTPKDIFQRKADMLEHNTFGSGMRSVLLNGTGSEVMTQEQPLSTDLISGEYRLVEVQGGFSRMGRDLDASNNVIGSADCYYSTFPDKPYLLTFRNRLLAWHNWGSNRDTPPSFVHAASPDLLPIEEQAARNSYNAISKDMPVYNADGTIQKYGSPVSTDLANIHLVPNDSRAYKLKLALWQLLDEKTNGEKLSKINVGIAQTYKSYKNTTWNSFVYHGRGLTDAKMAIPGELNYYGAWMGQQIKSRISSSTSATEYTENGINSPHGGGSNFLFGYTTNSPNPQTMGQKVKFDVSNYGGGSPNDSDTNRSWSRALLTMPFDRLYEIKNDQPPVSTDHLRSFIKLIDGIERYPTTMDVSVTTANGTSAIPNNNEIFAIGVNLVASGLYGGRVTVPPSLGIIKPGVGSGGIYHQNRPDTAALASSLIQYANNNAVSMATDEGNLFLEKKPNSEGLQAGQAVGSVIDFFSPPAITGGTGYQNGLAFGDDTKGFFPVTGSCQQNWVVLFVTGNEALRRDDDPTKGYTTAEAALKLFQNTLKMRGRKWNGGTWEDSAHTYDMDSGVRTIVVGIVDDDIAKYPDAETMVEEIRTVAKYGDPIPDPNIPGGWIPNPDAKAYFAKDVKGIMEALDAILKRIAVGSMGSGSPVSMPPLEGVNPDGSRTIIAASMKINNNDQWNAQLNRIDMKINNDEVDRWKADDKMVAKVKETPNTRQLYTWFSNGSGPIELRALRGSGRWNSIAGIQGRENAEKFRDWLYSFDVYAPPPNGSIGVLGEMSRSNIMVVGKPKAPSLLGVTGRDPANGYSVYLQTNRGFLHSLNYATGEERWAFIPPNIFKDRIKHLKFDEHDNWIEGASATDVRSNPMALLDGKIIAKDVRIPHYATVLVGYLGRGGNGFYAMDITNADVTEPTFEWAIENANYGTGVNDDDNVLRWGKAHGSGEYDYSKLGLTIVPGVFITPKGDPTIDVGVLPGGLGHRNAGGTPPTKSRGDVFYFFDPADGSIRHKVDGLGTLNTHSRTLGMGISPIVYREDSLKLTHSFYTADSEGNILFCDTSEHGPLSWTIDSVFRLSTVDSGDVNGNNKVSDDLPVVIPYAMVHSSSGARHEWLFGGTADIAGPGSTRLDDAKKLHNKQQFIFGLNLSNIKKEDANNPQKWTSNNTGFRTKDLEERDYFKDDIAPAYSPKDYSQNLSVNSTSLGWYLRLRPKIAAGSGDPQGTDAEYVSAPPFLFNGVLYVGTFISYSDTPSDPNCTNIGVSKFYSLSPSTGVPLVEPTTMENVRITGFSGSGSRLSMSVQELRSLAVAAAVDKLDNAKQLAGGSVIEMKSPGVGEVPIPPIPANTPYIEYWREKFQ